MRSLLPTTVTMSLCHNVNKRLASKMAAYIAINDRSVLAKPHGDTKSSATQNTTHKEILSKYLKFPRLCMLSVH